jgi:hypothetical protein
MIGWISGQSVEISLSLLEGMDVTTVSSRQT